MLIGLMSWGGGGAQQSFILGGSAPRTKPLPFYVPFLIEKVPFCILPIENGTPFIDLIGALSYFVPFKNLNGSFPYPFPYLNS